ncbi:MAG: zinc ribbon domain-containing protein [Candidatus Bathyarchaeota archaeon]|nr:zinc ribbon domain-containing protein [Candidatus Bathyarchaeota archaeon]
MTTKPTFCTHCGASLPEGALVCPQCGIKLQADDTGTPNIPPSSGVENIPGKRGGGPFDHLSTGFNIAISNPMVFVPTIIAGVINVIISFITSGIYFLSWMTLLEIVSSVISFTLGFASIYLARDAFDKKTLNLGESIKYVLNRFVSFVLAGLLGALLSITVVLIPVAILMFVIMVVDETGITDALRKAFKVLLADLGDILVILVVAILGSFILGYVPFLSTFLVDALYVVIGLACIDVYWNFKHQ